MILSEILVFFLYTRKVRDSHRCDGTGVKGRGGDTENGVGGGGPELDRDDQDIHRKTDDKESQEVAGAWGQMNEISDASRRGRVSKPTENDGSNEGEPHSGIGRGRREGMKNDSCFHVDS